MSTLQPATPQEFRRRFETFRVVRFLYRQDGCGHLIPIPHPNRGGTFFAPTELHVDAAHIPVACHECGRVTLYSPHNIVRMHSDSRCPYQVGKVAFAYLEVKGIHSDCEPPARIRAVWDEANKRLACAKPLGAWEIDREVKCPHGRPLRSPLSDSQHYYLADMPF